MIDHISASRSCCSGATTPIGKIFELAAAPNCTYKYTAASQQSVLFGFAISPSLHMKPSGQKKKVDGPGAGLGDAVGAGVSTGRSKAHPAITLPSHCIPHGCPAVQQLKYCPLQKL